MGLRRGEVALQLGVVTLPFAALQMQRAAELNTTKETMGKWVTSLEIADLQRWEKLRQRFGATVQPLRNRLTGRRGNVCSTVTWLLFRDSLHEGQLRFLVNHSSRQLEQKTWVHEVKLGFSLSCIQILHINSATNSSELKIASVPIPI